MAFQGCTSLENIVIPKSVTAIGGSSGIYFGIGMFANCTNLTNVKFADGSLLEIVGAEAFRGCTSIISINIPEGVKFIEEYAFEGCTSLESIVIPKSITSIGFVAFIRCASLEKVFYGGADSTAWNKIKIDNQSNNNSVLINAKRFYYSKTQLATNPQNFWRFVDDVPTVWE